jgi:hypothetical protein
MFDFRKWAFAQFTTLRRSRMAHHEHTAGALWAGGYFRTQPGSGRLRGASWSNDHNAREMHRILEKVTKAAEMAIGGISTAMIKIYDECVPDLEDCVLPSVDEPGK